MESVRILELFAPGIPLGATLEVELIPSKAPVCLEETADVCFSVVLPKGIKPPSLESNRGQDLKVSRGPFEPEINKDGRVQYRVPCRFIGKKGESILRILIQDSEFHGTIGITEAPVYVDPPRMRMVMEDTPVKWDGEKGLLLNVRLSSSGKEKTRGKLKASLIDSGGRRAQLTRSRPIKVNFIETTSVGLKAPPGLDIGRGNLDLRLDLETEKETFAEIIKGAVYLREGSALSVSIPESGKVGGGLEVTIKPLEGGELPKVVRFLLVMGEEEIPLDVRETTLEGGDITVHSLLLPPGRTGEFGIRVIGDEMLLHSSTILIEEEPPVLNLRIVVEPSTVKPGSRVSIRVKATLSDDAPEGLKANVVLGRERTVETDVDLVGPDVEEEVYLEIPDGFPLGIHPCRVTALKDGVAIASFRDKKALQISTDASIPLRLMTPHSLNPDADPSVGIYLFPGEEVVEESKTGSLEVKELSTGRMVLLHHSMVCHGMEWSEELTPMARDLFLVHSIRRSLEGAMGGMRDAADLSGVAVWLSHKRGRKPPKKGIPRYWEVDPSPPVKGSAEGSVIHSYLCHVTDEESDSHKDRPVRGPIKMLADGLDGLFQSGKMDDERQGMRDIVEGIMKKMKKLEASLDTGRASGAYMHSLGRLRGSLEALDNGAWEDARRYSENQGSLKSVLMNLLISSLIRIEVISTWTDPVIGVWDDLRIERQKAIKREIQALLELSTNLEDVRRRALDRLAGNERNMGARRELASVSGIVMTGARELSGPIGEVWEGEVLLRADTGGDLAPKLSVVFSDDRWKLVSPVSEREGNAFEIGIISMEAGGQAQVDLRIRSPDRFDDKGECIIYAAPDRLSLDEEGWI